MRRERIDLSRASGGQMGGRKRERERKMKQSNLSAKKQINPVLFICKREKLRVRDSYMLNT